MVMAFLTRLTRRGDLLALLLGVVALYSPKQSYDELFISNYATINLVDEIRSTPGIGDASLFGPQDYAMRAWVRTDRLTGLGLTSADVIKAIQSQNMQAAVGRIGARPMPDDQQLQLNIQTKGRLTSVAEFQKIAIRTNQDGSVLRLGDIARLELGAANLDRSTRLNGAPAALIAIYQSPGANALDALGAVKTLMAQYTQSSGMIDQAEERLNKTISLIDRQMADMQRRLDVQRASMVKEYAAADMAMTQLKNQSGALSAFGSSTSSTSSSK